MKIVCIVHAGLLDPARVATGNELRLWQFEQALREAGHALTVLHPAGLIASGEALPSGHQLFDGPAQLLRRLRRLAPDAVVVGYWEYLQALPAEPPWPVVLDLLAPRPLELLFEAPEQAGPSFRQLLGLLRRVDHVLVGNSRQRDLVLGWLLAAGIDCRHELPISIMPNARASATAPRRSPAGQPWRLVSGGVGWPWRQTRAWLDRLEVDLIERPGVELLSLSGAYKYHQTTERGAEAEAEGLRSYADWWRLLTQRAHVGLELAESNVERHFAQSFRVADYLAAGLPVMISAALPMAELIARHRAGWVLETPDDLARCLDELLALSPEGYQAMSSAALGLARSSLSPEVAAQPLLDWLARPLRPGRQPAWASESMGSSRTRRSVWPSLAGRIRNAFFHRLFSSLQAPLQRLHRPGANSAMLVTRGDTQPATHGAAVKIDRTAWGLSFLFDEVLIVSERRDSYLRYRRGMREACRLPLWLRPLGLQRRLGLLRMLGRGMPDSEAYLYTPRVDRVGFLARGLYVACRHGVRWFQAEFPAYGFPVLQLRRLLGGRALLVEHNIEYQRIAQQFPECPDSQLAWLRELELHVARAVDRVIVVSERDRKQLLSDGVAESQVVVIPHGVDLQSFNEQPALDLRERLNLPADEPVLIYHGTYRYGPNLEAMSFMAEDILPMLEARGCRVQLVALGDAPPVHALHPRIHFTGPVDAVAGWLKGADLAVVPLREGGGTRMKILDYFAARLPVISTSKGIEGIPIEPGREAVVVDEVEDFAEAIIRLLGQPASATALAAAGRRFVEDQDWRRIAERYVALFTDENLGQAATATADTA